MRIKSKLILVLITLLLIVNTIYGKVKRKKNILPENN